MREPLYTVAIQGLSDAERIPDELEQLRREFPGRAAEALAVSLRERLARDPHAPHGEKIVAVSLGDGAIRVGTEGSHKARALEEGATILAAKGRSTRSGRPHTLRFEIDGKIVFRRRVVIQRNRPGGKPFARALRNRKTVMQNTWDAAKEATVG